MGVKVRQKAKGKGNPWWIFIHHDGERKSIKVGDKRKAERQAAKIERLLATGQYELKTTEKEQKVRFKPLAEEWIEEIKAARKWGTYERYNQVLGTYILPAFGSKAISGITKGDIKNYFIKKMNDGYSKANINIFKYVLSGVFNHAMDKELVEKNPTYGITKNLGLDNDNEDGEGEIDPLNFEESRVFLDTVKAHFPDYYAFIFMALRTGMRLGELLAVKWGDIDFNSKYVLVCRTYKRGRFTATKNKKTRKVDMSESLKGVLKEQATRQKRDTLKNGWSEPPELVFTNKDGKPFEQNHLRRVFKRMLKKAGLREIRFHDLRHTFASQMLSLGESPVYVKEQLGHHSIQLTVDTYGHWIKSRMECGANKLDNPDMYFDEAPAENEVQKNRTQAHPGNKKAATR